MEFAVTFGQQYSSEPHPRVRYAHPDGWLTMEADNMGHARHKAFEELGPAWAFIYPMHAFESDKHFYPMGELHRI